RRRPSRGPRVDADLRHRRRRVPLVSRGRRGHVSATLRPALPRHGDPRSGGALRPEGQGRTHVRRCCAGEGPRLVLSCQAWHGRPPLLYVAALTDEQRKGEGWARRRTRSWFEGSGKSRRRATTTPSGTTSRRTASTTLPCPDS